MASASEWVMVRSERRACIASNRRSAPPVNRSCGGPNWPEDFDVLPEHAARMAGAERLHRGFLCREPGRQAGNWIPVLQKKRKSLLSVNRHGAGTVWPALREQLGARWGSSLLSHPSPRTFDVLILSPRTPPSGRG